MNTVSIDAAKLTDLCNSIRRLQGLTNKERRTAITSILMQADALRFADTENLVCLKCATKLAHYAADSSIFRLGESGRIRVFRLCHKDYYDRREILSLPPVGQMNGQKRPLQR